MSRYSLFLLAALCGVLQPAAAQLVQSTGQIAKPVAKRMEPSKVKRVPLADVTPLAELSAAQLAIANRVALGKMPCELAAHVNVKPDIRGAGRFVLELGSQKYAMVPVPTLTGAIRLEDAAAGVVWLQLSNKSMLMSQKQGKRLADACASADQLIVAKELERNPAPSLLDAPVRLQTFSQAAVAAAPEISVAADGAAR
jgi:hypothetical protein